MEEFKTKIENNPDIIKRAVWDLDDRLCEIIAEIHTQLVPNIDDITDEQASLIRSIIISKLQLSK